jgi:hypothetical protein
MKKILVLAAFGAGYVLGAKAGRGRYEEIKGGAQEIWEKPEVQRVAQGVKDEAKVAGDRASEVAKDAAASVSASAKEAASGAKEKAAAVKESVSKKADAVDGRDDEPDSGAASTGTAPTTAVPSQAPSAPARVGDELETKGVKDTLAGDVVFDEANGSDATHERTQPGGGPA